MVNHQLIASLSFQNLFQFCILFLLAVHHSSDYNPRTMTINREYQDALDYLYTFVDYSLTRSFRYSPDKFDLDRMREFTRHLDMPQTTYPVIHVAGTKGKGSVSALCASALQAAGYDVGLYTSPHLQEFTERIKLNGQDISQADFVELVNEVKPYLEPETRLTTFEIATGLALLYFAKKKASAVVLEVGLGGRLDATNIVDPIVTVITSISYDHSEFLGDTLAKIAGEKAGIIKTGVPLVVSPQKEEALNVIAGKAKEKSAPLIQVGRDYLFAPSSHTTQNQTFLVWSASEQPLVDSYIESGGVVEWEPTRLSIPLLGYHQVENAATAYTALQIALKSGLEIKERHIRSGFKSVNWPARFEILQKNPVIVIDSAHNRDSALKLRLALDDYFPGKKVVLVFGASEDKDIEGMFSELLPRVEQVIATKSYHPRAIEPDALVEIAHRFGRPVRVIQQVEDAVEEALQMVNENGLVLVTGSIFVAAGARHTWYNRNGDQVSG
jgi:dihydrofolate synthase/folylpolyglutamate synthase